MGSVLEEVQLTHILKVSIQQFDLSAFLVEIEAESVEELCEVGVWLVFGPANIDVFEFSEVDDF